MKILWVFVYMVVDKKFGYAQTGSGVLCWVLALVYHSLVKFLVVSEQIEIKGSGPSVSVELPIRRLLRFLSVVCT